MEERYYAVDPGVTTGWALFIDGIPVEMGEVETDKTLENFCEWLNRCQPVSLWVVEDYLIRPAPLTHGYAHQWNPAIASRVIGAINFRAYGDAAEVILQQPSIKPQASQLSGIPYVKGKPGQHKFDAILHGVYYWHKEHPDAAAELYTGSKELDSDGVRRPARVVQSSTWRVTKTKRG